MHKNKDGLIDELNTYAGVHASNTVYIKDILFLKKLYSLLIYISTKHVVCLSYDDSIERNGGDSVYSFKY